MHWSWIDLQYVSQDPVDSDGDGDDEADSNDDDDDDDDDEEADSNDDDDEEEAAVLQCSDRGFLPPMKDGYCPLFTEHHHRRSRHSLNWFQWMSIVQSKVQQHLLWYQFGALHYWLSSTLLVNSNSLHCFSKLTSQYNRVKIRMERFSAKYPIVWIEDALKQEV